MKPGALPRGQKKVKPAACEGPKVGETWNLALARFDLEEAQSR